jgi:nucleoside 2-deoxyribosyltransferase
MLEQPSKCFITDLDTFPSHNNKSGGIMQYTIKPLDKNINLVFSAYANHWSKDDSVCYGNSKPTEYFIKEKLKDIKHILYGLMLNNKWPKIDYLITADNIDDIINNSSFPKTPNDKLYNLFFSLCNEQKFDGEYVKLSPSLNQYIFQRKEYYTKLYFVSVDEYLFYLNTLEGKGLIELTRYVTRLPLSYTITYLGLEELIKKQEEGKYSNNCFVAMSFDNDDEPKYYEAIEPACRETGFLAKRVDLEHYDSEKTINDAIIALLKECRFCIADFTKHKDGVYFESGYALGRGMKVIYTCHKDSFKEIHFDINHFPHIIYENTTELKEKLINKIKAFIIE